MSGEVDAVSTLFKPRSVAIIGASSDASKTAGRPLMYLLKHGFSGSIYPVNPRAANICGLQCYPDVRSLPETPDVGIVLLGAERAHLAVRDLAQRGTPTAIVLAGGYAEAGERGLERQQQLVDAAGPMRILGPNTIGLVNLTDSVCLSASGVLSAERFSAGTIGVVSQSGGILGALLSRAAARSIGLSKLVSTGNEADFEVADLVCWLADDPKTKVIAMYIEGIRDPGKFRMAAMYAAERGKPLVAFKVGRSEAGIRAASSHTGALVGSSRMYSAFFKDLGVLQARTLGELLDISLALDTGRVLRGKRVAILTTTGGAGTLLADSFGMFGFEVPAPDRRTAAKLQALQTGLPTTFDANPVDLTLAGLEPNVLRGAVRALLESSGYDALAVVVGASGVGSPHLVADAVHDCLGLNDKPVVAFISPHAPRAESALVGHGVPAYSAAENCSAALWGMWQHRYRGVSCCEVSASQQVDLPSLSFGQLDEYQAKQLFSQFGIQAVPETVVTTTSQAAGAATAFGDRVVLKILSGEVTHKSDVGGVAIDLSPDQIEFQMEKMAVEVKRKTGTAPKRFLVQKMLQGGTELILGVRRGPLGVAILLGTGGLAAELFNDTSVRFLPEGRGLSREQVTEMLHELKALTLLSGFRGQPKGDVEALITTVVSFSRMVGQLDGQLIEAEINPLLVLPEAGGAWAIDGFALLKPPAGI